MPLFLLVASNGMRPTDDDGKGLARVRGAHYDCSIDYDDKSELFHIASTYGVLVAKSRERRWLYRR
jgi:hypothetical protein